jgi:hypothetical protein
VEGPEPVLGLAVIDGHLDGHARVDEADQGGGHADVVRGTSVHRAGEAGDVGGQPTTDHQDGFFAQQSEILERIDDSLGRFQRLAGLFEVERKRGELDLVMAEVGAHLLAVQVEDRLVDHHQAAAVGAVVFGNLGVADREGAVDVDQRIVDLFVGLDVEGGVRGSEGGLGGERHGFLRLLRERKELVDVQRGDLGGGGAEVVISGVFVREGDAGEAR